MSLNLQTASPSTAIIHFVMCLVLLAVVHGATVRSSTTKSVTMKPERVLFYKKLNLWASLMEKMPNDVVHCKKQMKPGCLTNLELSLRCGFNGSKYCLFANGSYLRCAEGGFRRVQLGNCTQGYKKKSNQGKEETVKLQMQL